MQTVTRNILKTKNKNHSNRHSKSFVEEDIVKTAPLSSSQKEMWIIDQMQPGNYAYNLSIAYRLTGDLNVKLLEHSFNNIIQRHEILRTTFSSANDHPLQYIHRNNVLKIKKMNCTNSGDGKTGLNDLLRREVTRPFDISKLPLIRVTTIKLSSTENILLLSMHHIISDGFSLMILFEELSRLYNCSSNNPGNALPKLEYQYTDYVKLENEKNLSPPYDEQLNYWINQFNDQSGNLGLPLDKTRPSIQSPAGSNEFFVLPKTLIDKLNSIGISKGCTFYMTFLAAFQIFLSKYSDNDDIIVGSPLSNRPDIAKNLIGNFLNVTALLNNISEYADFPSLLLNTRQVVLNTLKYRDLSFEKLVNALKIKRDLSRNPVFQVMLQILPKISFNLKDLEVTHLNFDLGYSQLDLSLHLYQTDDGYNCRLEYDTDLFDRNTIKRMIINFHYFLNELVKNPEIKLREISVINPKEKSRVINEWNNTQINYPQDITLTQLFEQQAAQTPDKFAIKFGDRKITYNELNRKANQLGKYLKSIGIGPGSIVGVCLDRSFEMVIGILGILKAGGAYLPVDPDQPAERIHYILEDACVKLILTLKKNDGIFNRKNNLLLLDSDRDRISRFDSQNMNHQFPLNNAAYIIYTSGSTGNPKGVIIEQKSVVNFLLSMKQNPGISPDDVLLAVTTISFDIAGLEIFLPLISGAGIILANKSEISDGKLLIQLILDNEVTMMQATPSTWKLMIDAGWNKTPDLKMLCGGEAFPKTLANSLLERGGELWNMYGPTETTIWSSVNNIEKGDKEVTIGKPIANTEFFIVDKNLNLVPIGAAGELLISGAGLARGYLGNDKLTSEKFIPNHIKEDGSRLYRTGDKVKSDADGRMHFLGRLDYQVKIRGHRIECGEVESVISKDVNIQQCVVKAVEVAPTDIRLAAYFIPVSFNNFSIEDLKKKLNRTLPAYMIPSFFVKMEQFPLTQNGKLDRKKLPFPDSTELESERQYVPPRDDLDLQLILIWENAFGIKNIGINDDFFDLGGHSLLAAHIFSRIHKYLGKNLPLAALFQTSTISGLADIIRGKNWKPLWRSIVPLRTTGNKPPIFLVHGAEGNILLYKNLINHLDADYPVYGLQSQGLDGQSPILDNVSEMAQKYIMEIKDVLPDGPYILGGYCLGGTIAYEIARQLKESGNEVVLVAMFETYNIQNNTPPFVLRTFHKFENLFFQVMNLYITSKESRLQYFSEKFNVEINRLKVKLKIVKSKLFSLLKIENNLSYQHLLINKINDGAQNSHSQKLFDGEVILFKPVRYFAGYNNVYFGWENLAGKNFNIINMPCYPRGSLNEPFVKLLAEKLGEVLNKNVISTIHSSYMDHAL